MPPYWSLGFHLCRWGYGTANKTMEVVKRMRSKGIPQVRHWAVGQEGQIILVMVPILLASNLVSCMTIVHLLNSAYANRIKSAWNGSFSLFLNSSYMIKLFNSVA